MKRSRSCPMEEPLSTLINKEKSGFLNYVLSRCGSYTKEWEIQQAGVRVPRRANPTDISESRGSLFPVKGVDTLQTPVSLRCLT